MVHNSYGTGKICAFEDLGGISDWWEALGTLFRENLGTQIYPFNQFRSQIGSRIEVRTRS